LHGAFDNARPSPDLAARILVGATTRRTRVPGRAIGYGLVGLVAVLLLAAIVPIAATLPAGPWVAASSTTSTTLSHHSRGDLEFDYPSSWRFSDDIGQTSGVLLWTGPNPVSCPPAGERIYGDLTAPGQVTAAPSDALCGVEAMISPGDVFVAIRKMQVSATTPLIDPAQPSMLVSGARFVTVAGIPAIFAGSTAPSGVEILDWTLDVPQQPYLRLTIHAEIRNPGAAETGAQVQSLVASVRYTSPIAALDPSQGPVVAQRWLQAHQSGEPGLACFSGPSGAKVQATTSSFYQGPVLTQPLPVSCEWTVEPTVIGLWKVTLTEWWSASVDRNSGTYVIEVWLNPDGSDNLIQLIDDQTGVPGSFPYAP